MIFIKALVSILLFAINVCGKDCFPENEGCEPFCCDPSEECKWAMRRADPEIWGPRGPWVAILPIKLTIEFSFANLLINLCLMKIRVTFHYVHDDFQ